MKENGTYSDEYFMRFALDEALKAYETGEIPVGAVVVYDNMVIGKAHNLTEKLRDATAHAEMQAITAAAYKIGSKYLLNCTLYVTVEPCTMCAGAMHWTQISRIVYGASDKKKGYNNICKKSINEATEVKSGVLARESQDLMLRFFKKIRK